MPTILFILTVIFVGYIIYVTFPMLLGTSEEAPTSTTPVKDESETAPKPVAAVKTPTTAAAAKVAPAMPGPALDADVFPEVEPPLPKVTEFRDPKTGDIAANPSSYRFAKRWIKEALVEEGLLDRVYRNNELKGDVKGKVKDALDRFKQMEKYHG